VLRGALFALLKPGCSGFMKRAIIGWGICLVLLGTVEVALSATREQRIVTRVDTVTVVLKHRTLVIAVTGTTRTPTAMGRRGKLLRRNSDRPLDKDGLVEYELVFNAVPNYSGFKMKPIKASLKDRSAPEGVKGVRVFSEYNQVDGLLPEPKKRKSLIPSFGKKRPDDRSQETTGSITGSSPHP
jgi:hypothetical protein